MDNSARSGELARTLAELATSLSGQVELDRLLPQIVTAARRATGARYAALGVVAEDSDVIVRFIHEGMDAELVDRIGPTPTGGGLLGTIVRKPALVVTDDLSTHPDSAGFPPHHPPMKEFLGLPVRLAGRVFGNLYLTEKAGGFDQRDIDVVSSLAALAGLAIRNAQMAQDLRVLAVQDERVRISRDLHDGVIQALFSIGMSLEGVWPLIRSDPDRVEDRVNAAIDQLDATIKEIRSTIFTLRGGQPKGLSLEQGLAELAQEYRDVEGGVPSVQIASTTDGRVDDDVIPDVLHIVREALSNAARHAHTSSVQILAHIEDSTLFLEVRDRGEGFDPDRVVLGHGLGNMAERAALLGADLNLNSRPSQGTTIALRVPLQGSDTRPE